MNPRPARRAAALGKLASPRLGRVFDRERLFELLDGWSEAPAVWLAAPPGAGKNKLAAIRRQGEVWVTDLSLSPQILALTPDGPPSVKEPRLQLQVADAQALAMARANELLLCSAVHADRRR
jgi:hypothetical protein